MSPSCALFIFHRVVPYNCLLATTRGLSVNLTKLTKSCDKQTNNYRFQHAYQDRIDVYQSDPTVSSENDYIFKHIHGKMFDRYQNVKEAVTLPIYPLIKRLDNPMHSVEKKDLLESIRHKIHQMNQMELATLLTYLKNYDKEEHRIVKQIIDFELRWLLKEHIRTRSIDLDLWFYISNIFYQSRTKSTFNYVLINYLVSENEIALTNRQILQLLFLIVLSRRNGGKLLQYERRILEIVPNASIEDVAIICLAYFKTQTTISNVELLRKIIDKTTENLPILDPKQPGYCSIVKSVRYSRNMECRENVLSLVKSLTNSNRHVIFTSPYNAVQTVKLMESFRVYDSKLLDLFRSIMFENLEEFRIKDIQYALTSLSNFAYQDLQIDDELRRDFNRLAQHIFNEIRKDVDHQYFHLIPILRALATFGYYNDELIAYSNRILNDPEKFSMMRNVLEFEKSVLLAFSAVMIEGGKEKIQNTRLLRDMAALIDRKGNFGSVKQDSSLKHLDFILRDTSTKPKLANSNSFRIIARSLAQTPELRESKYLLHFQYTLPHQNYADLVVSKNRREPGSFDAKTLLPAYFSPSESHCLVLATQQTDFIDGNSRLCGYKRFLIRMFNRLNYRVVTADFHDQDIYLLARNIKKNLD